MIFQLYITRLKCLFRNKTNVFWNYLFPIMLATCYFFAFDNLLESHDFSTISIAYVNGDTQADNFKEVLTSVTFSENVPMFDVTFCDQNEAKKLMEEGKVAAYLVGSEDPQLYVKENGMNQTIVKSFLDNYRQKSEAVSNILRDNPNAAKEGLLTDILQSSSYVEEVKEGNDPDFLLIFYYALMAYTCIFAANWGIDEAVNIQADLSARAARINVTPIRKMRLFLSNLAAAYTAHLGSILLMFLYMNFVIKVDFGDNLFYLLFICCIGSFTGLVLGCTIGIWVKKKPEVKQAILMAVVLGGGFLAGMMSSDIKYLVQQKLPWLGYVNPVNLVADAMYSLYYYDTYNRFYFDAALLCIITVVLGIAAYAGVRRKSYASL